MIYDITLRMRTDYAVPAVAGRHLVRLLPRDLPGEQRVLGARLDMAPFPEERLDGTDFFGNRTTALALRHPHDQTLLTLTARVERLAPSPDPHPGCLLEEMPQALAASRDLGPDAPHHFTAPSVRVPRDTAMTAYARAQLRPGLRVAEAAAAVAAALHRDMTFDPEATRVDTPAAEAFAARAGVCQDLSHVMIACLRGIGVPAGYVSGFLRTRPPPGQPRLAGADAMHAWVRAWCGPDAGWRAFDPTNATPAGADHIVVAMGRDYFDVAPVKGVLRASGGQASAQEVDVVVVTSEVPD